MKQQQKMSPFRRVGRVGRVARAARVGRAGRVGLGFSVFSCSFGPGPFPLFVFFLCVL